MAHRVVQKWKFFVQHRPGLGAWIALIYAVLAAMLQTAQAAAPQQTLLLGEKNPYAFVAFASEDLQRSVPAERIVVLLHGVRRNADDYYRHGLRMLEKAGWAAPGTLLVAPNFLTAADPRAGENMPLWPRGQWMQGTASTEGRPGIPAFSVLDDLLAYFSNRARFPDLRELVLMGHSAGGQLMQRYSIVGEGPDRIRDRGVAVRFVVSSPSSYLYLEGSRLQDGVFQPVSGKPCPDFNRYRYGLEEAPEYLARQKLGAEPLFGRYAARDVTYIVGEQDNNPNHRALDRSCGALMQGTNRLERQLNYLRYEAFLSKKWAVPIGHPQFQVPGAGHGAGPLLASSIVARILRDGR